MTATTGEGASTPYEHALALAARGFDVFPLIEGAKLPLIDDFPNRATRDPVTIRAWWFDEVMGWSQPYNVGISTSRYGDDGESLLAVDVDDKNDKHGSEELATLEAAHGALPATFVQRTASGGRHILFRQPAGAQVASGVDVLARGLDIRGQGGFVVGAGSAVEKGPYTVAVDAPLALAPGWLVGKCKPAAGARQAATSAVDADAASAVDPARATLHAIRYLKTRAPVAVEGAGGDHAAYRVACAVKDYGVGAFECVELLLDHWNDQCSPPWQADALHEKVMHAYKYGRLPVGAAMPEMQFPCAPLPEGADAVPAPPLCARGLISAADVGDSDQRRYLVKGLLAFGELSVLYAVPNAGKSFFAAALEWAIASGQPFQGRKTRRALTVHVSAEGGAGFAGRIRALKLHHRSDAAGVPFTYLPRSVDLTSAPAVAEMIELVKAKAAEFDVPAGLVVIDTLAASAPGTEENTAAAMGLIVAAAERIAAATGAHVMFVHHPTKAGDKGPRGSSVLIGAVSTSIEIDENRVAWVRKQRDGETGRPMPFKLLSVQIGADEDGDAVGSCVCVQDESAPDAGDDFAPASAKEQGAIDALVTAIEASEGQPVKRLEWQSEAALTRPEINLNGESKRAFHRLAAALVEKSLVRASGRGNAAARRYSLVTDKTTDTGQPLANARRA